MSNETPEDVTPKPPEGLPEDHGLGAFLFTCGQARTSPWLFRVSWIAFASALALPFITQAPMGVRAMGGAIAAFLGIALAILSLSDRILRHRYLAVFEHGLIRRRGRKRFDIHRYADAEALFWRLTKIVVNNIPVGDRFQLKVRRRDGSKYAIAGQLSQRNRSIEEVKELYADAIARSLARQLAQEDQLPWSDRLTLYPDALGIHRSKTHAQRGDEPRYRIPYGAIAYRLTPERMKLRSIDDRRARHTTRRSRWNFEPGLLVFQALCESAVEDRALEPEEASVES